MFRMKPEKEAKLVNEFQSLAAQNEKLSLAWANAFANSDQHTMIQIDKRRRKITKRMQWIDKRVDVTF